MTGDVTASANGRADVTLYRNMGNNLVGQPLWSGSVIASAANVAPDPELPPYYPPTSYLHAYGVSFGDVDSDGDEDMLLADRASYLYVYANDGLGNFTPVRYNNISTGTRPFAYARIHDVFASQMALAAGDVNGDSRPDIVVGGTDGAWEGKVDLLLNDGLDSDGHARFTNTGTIGGAGTDVRGLAIGAVNPATDSYDDIVFGNYEGGIFSLVADRLDTDGDGIVDRYDNLDEVANYPTIDLDFSESLNRFDQIDLDGDGLGSVLSDDGSQLLGDPDADNDGVANPLDNLPFVPNADQRDLDADGIGEIDGPWPLWTLGDPLDDRDPDADGVPNGPFDPALAARYKAAKQKMMTGTTPIILRIDALGRLWQAEFTQTLADSICLDEATFAAKYPRNWDGTWGAPNPAGTAPPGPGLEGGKSLPVSVMLIPKMLWTDTTVVSYLTDRLAYPTFELGQHGTYHTAMEQPPSEDFDSEMTGYDALEMFVYMRVGQDTMTGVYDRPGPSDYLGAVAGNPLSTGREPPTRSSASRRPTTSTTSRAVRRPPCSATWPSPPTSGWRGSSARRCLM